MYFILYTIYYITLYTLYYIQYTRTAEQGAEHFMAKWIVAEKTKAGLRHAVVCPNETRRTKKRIAQNKRARAGLLALVD